MPIIPYEKIRDQLKTGNIFCLAAVVMHFQASYKSLPKAPGATWL